MERVQSAEPVTARLPSSAVEVLQTASAWPRRLYRCVPLRRSQTDTILQVDSYHDNESLQAAILFIAYLSPQVEMALPLGPAAILWMELPSVVSE